MGSPSPTRLVSLMEALPLRRSMPMVSSSSRGMKTGLTQVDLGISDGISTPVQTSIPLHVVQEYL